MTKDNLDKSLWIALIIVIVAAFAIPFFTRNNSSTPSSISSVRANDQQMLREARLFMIQKRYEPIETLMKSGQHQQALLKLEEIARSYPADPHAYILRGELLSIMGAPAEAAASFAQGVRLEGGYVDKNSPISKREPINRLVESELLKIKSNPASQSELKNLRYLQSRLAGGCE
jgi:tetratricopeptide (TPR) repeat protein